MSIVDTPTFKQLRIEWYKKLKSSGFNDIEYLTHDYLKTNAKQVQLNPWIIEGMRPTFRDEYFSICRDFHNSNEFALLINKYPHYEAIWALHCDGYFITEIARSLGRPMYGVRFIVRRIARIMMGKELFYDVSHDYLRFTYSEEYQRAVLKHNYYHEVWLLHCCGLKHIKIGDIVKKSRATVRAVIRNLRNLYYAQFTHPSNL